MKRNTKNKLLVESSEAEMWAEDLDILALAEDSDKSKNKSQKKSSHSKMTDQIENLSVINLLETLNLQTTKKMVSQVEITRKNVLLEIEVRENHLKNLKSDGDNSKELIIVIEEDIKTITRRVIVNG